jgi:hypothetical protein
MDFVHDIPIEEYNKLSDYYWLAVIGSREYTNYETIQDNLDYLINALVKSNTVSYDKLLIVSGKARGIDRLALRYANEHNILDVNILADWDKYGNSAGMKRNPHIIKRAKRVVAFQLNKSRGTQNGIDHARRLNIPCHVIPLIG